MGLRSSGGRWPGRGGRPWPRCEANHRRRSAPRPTSKFCPSGPSTSATPASMGTTTKGGTLGLRGLARDLLVDGHEPGDLVLLGARRHPHLHHVALLVVQQALADGGAGRDAAGGGVGLLRGHEV